MCDRLVAVEVSYDLWQKMMTTGNLTELHCKKGLPKDAKLRRVFGDPRPWINEPLSIVFVFEHPSFDIVPEGDVIPRFFPEFIEISRKKGNE